MVSGRARFWLEFTLGGLAVGRLLAWGSLEIKNWQWLEEATALRRVGFLDDRSAVARPNCLDGTLQLTSANLIDNPGHLQPYFWQVEKNRPCRTHFWGPLSYSTKTMFLKRVLVLICKT